MLISQPILEMETCNGIGADATFPPMILSVAMNFGKLKKKNIFSKVDLSKSI